LPSAASLSTVRICSGMPRSSRARASGPLISRWSIEPYRSLASDLLGRVCESDHARRPRTSPDKHPTI
jgi:hypothetical protein